MINLILLLLIHPLGDLIPLHGFVKNLGAKSSRIALDKDYGHYRRAILCLSRPDFPQNPCSTDVFRIMYQTILGDTIDAQIQLIPKLTDHNPTTLDWQIIPVTVISISFVVVGIEFRFGGF